VLLAVERDERAAKATGDGDINRVGTAQCVVGGDLGCCLGECVVERDEGDGSVPRNRSAASRPAMGHAACG
jgi:hypothetical protein